MIDAIALQRAVIIGVANLAANSLEVLPVFFRRRGADVLLEMAHHVGDDAIVIDQRIVDVEEKYDMLSHLWAAPPPIRCRSGANSTQFQCMMIAQFPPDANGARLPFSAKRLKQNWLAKE